jgi:BirA family biotin operon repressor/biotin-[acetyl-CoA-carboxylase] ligase
VNINSSPSQFPDEIKNKSTSLKELSQANWRMHELAAKIIKVCLKASEECFQGVADNKLFQEWAGMDFLAGKKVKIENGKDSFHGKANGIDESGGLLIKLRNGKEKVVHAGEVSLIL